MPRYGTDSAGKVIIPDTSPEKHTMISALLLVIITLFIPPVGVFIVGGCGADLLINICLTILGYLPGHVHAYYLEYVYYKRREESSEGLFDNRAAPGVYSDNIQTGGRGYVERWCFGHKDNRGHSEIEMQRQDPNRGASDLTRVGSGSKSLGKDPSRQPSNVTVPESRPTSPEGLPPVVTNTQDVPALTADAEYVRDIAKLFSEVIRTPSGPQSQLT